MSRNVASEPGDWPRTRLHDLPVSISVTARKIGTDTQKGQAARHDGAARSTASDDVFTARPRSARDAGLRARHGKPTYRVVPVRALRPRPPPSSIEAPETGARRARTK